MSNGCRDAKHKDEDEDPIFICQHSATSPLADRVSGAKHAMLTGQQAQTEFHNNAIMHTTHIMMMLPVHGHWSNAALTLAITTTHDMVAAIIDWISVWVADFKLFSNLISNIIIVPFVTSCDPDEI